MVEDEHAAEELERGGRGVGEDLDHGFFGFGGSVRRNWTACAFAIDARSRRSACRARR